MSNKLDKIINLIRKTGDKIIVVDEKAEPQFAMMSIEEYEKLLFLKNESIVDLTEDQLLSKINRDIAIWKSEQKDQEFNSSKIEISDDLIVDPNSVEKNKKEDKEKYYFEPIDEDEEDFYELND